MTVMREVSLGAQLLSIAQLCSALSCLSFQLQRQDLVTGVDYVILVPPGGCVTKEVWLGTMPTLCDVLRLGA